MPVDIKKLNELHANAAYDDGELDFALRNAWPEIASELAELRSSVSMNSDFMAYMTGELAGFTCCCHDDGEHRDTPPMMWPELIGCIAARAVRDETAKVQVELAELRRANQRLSTAPDQAVFALKEAHEALDELGIPQAAGQSCNHDNCNCHITHRVRELGESRDEARNELAEAKEKISELREALRRIETEATELSKECDSSPHACPACEILFVAKLALEVDM